MANDWIPNGNPASFSDCNLQQIEAIRGELYCLYNYPDSFINQPQCGNSWIEIGEECDSDSGKLHQFSKCVFEIFSNHYSDIHMGIIVCGKFLRKINKLYPSLCIQICGGIAITCKIVF